jgi:hypothetical protein
MKLERPWTRNGRNMKLRAASIVMKWQLAGVPVRREVTSRLDCTLLKIVII